MHNHKAKLLNAILMGALCTLLISCKGHEQASETQVTAAPPAQAAPIVTDSFNNGVVIPSVPLRSDASQTFALYLPKTYNAQSKLPVIIFFDPHGDGSLPVNLYDTLAEKFGYILMGSNNSKNLVSVEQTTAFANSLITEAGERFHANTAKITLCGFSGGAKVALTSGSVNPAINTIIYAGASTELNPNHAITLLGFAGAKDMNYTDLVLFDQGLKNSSIPHYLVEWKGKHEFPAPDVFKDAFTFIETGKIENYEKKQAKISPEKLAEEQAMKQKYIQAFQQQDLSWWKTEIASLNVKKKTDPMSDRLLGFISLACYSITSRGLQSNQLQGLDKILAIYKLADPTNKDCDEMTAQYNQRKGK